MLWIALFLYGAARGVCARGHANTPYEKEKGEGADFADQVIRSMVKAVKKDIAEQPRSNADRAIIDLEDILRSTAP